MKLAVVTLSVGREGAEMLVVSRPLMKAYAARVGAAFHELRCARSSFPCGEKFRLRGALDHYDRLVYLDADVVFDPAALPDLFAAVPDDRIGAHDDFAATAKYRPAFTGWIQEEHDMLCDSQGVPRVAVTHAQNSGVLVVSRRHAGMFDPPPRPIPNKWCMEQWWSYVNARRHGYRFHWLPTELNYQFWFEHRMPSVAERPDVLLRHWAGAGQIIGHGPRLDLMRAAAKELGV